MEALAYMEFSVEEVAAMEGHSELIDRDLVITDKVTPAHSNAVGEISSALRQFIRNNGGECKVYTDNVALYCDELCKDAGNLFLPDIMTVCEKDGIKPDGVHVAPAFIAEVTSESTRKNDYGIKQYIYGKIGVREYWVVDLQERLVVRYLADLDFAPEIFRYPQIKALCVNTYPDLEIDLTEIFE